HIALDRRNGDVKAIAQVGDVSFSSAASKQILHHDPFEGRELTPLVRALELNEDVILLLEDDQLGDLLFANLDISPYRKVYENGGDISGIGAVVYQRPHFRRAHAFWGLVHGSD